MLYKHNNHKTHILQCSRLTHTCKEKQPKKNTGYMLNRVPVSSSNTQTLRKHIDGNKKVALLTLHPCLLLLSLATFFLFFPPLVLKHPQ